MNTSLFAHGAATAAEFRKLARQLSEQRARDRSRRASQKAELEEAVGRVALLARSLAELCLAKGVITPEELRAQMDLTDFEDGVRDGRLASDVVLPGESKLADLAPVRPERKGRGTGKKGGGKGRKKRPGERDAGKGARKPRW